MSIGTIFLIKEDDIHIRNLRLSFPFLGPSGTRIVLFGDFNGKMTAVRVCVNLSLMPNKTIRI
nr:MAG TPA: Endonuclease/Exonuclease/phosphatase family protein [Caudoviricetes sp.]